MEKFPQDFSNKWLSKLITIFRSKTRKYQLKFSTSEKNIGKGNVVYSTNKVYVFKLLDLAFYFKSLYTWDNMGSPEVKHAIAIYTWYYLRRLKQKTVFPVNA